MKERSFAPRLYQALLVAKRLVSRGERDAGTIKELVARILQRQPGMKIEYFDLVDPDTLRSVDAVHAPVRAAAAIWIGKTRLIDNILCEPPYGQTKSVVQISSGLYVSENGKFDQLCCKEKTKHVNG